MSNQKLVIPSIFSNVFASSPIGTSDEYRLPNFYDGNLSTQAQVINGGSAFTVTFDGGTPHIISEARIWASNSTYAPESVTVKTFFNDVEVRARTINPIDTGSNGVYTIFDLDSSTDLVDKVKIIVNSSYNPTFTLLEEIELYGLDINPNFEFNDSVLSTQAWNSSRYTGKQLQSAEINEYTAGDISYGNTPVIRSNNRTFYVATEVVSLSKSGSAAEDTSLQYIPNFSYIIVDKVITVNDDDTLTQVAINDIPDNTEGANNLTGLKREFQTNIPQGSQIGIINFDESVRNRSNKNYDVYFNRGRLQSILRFTGNSNVTAFGRPIVNPTSVSLYAGGQTNLQGSLTATNRKLVQEFYTGSFETLQRGAVSTSSIEDFFHQLIDYRNTADQKYFITVLNTSGSNFQTDIDTEPIRTIDTDAISTIAPTKNLAELSTTEIFNYEGGSSIKLDTKFQLNRSYNPGLQNGAGNQYSGSFDITALNEEKPALLINMNKELELPDGKGSKPIVVVPENLHPFIKDNLIHFCAKAGLDIGDRKVVPALNESRRNLK